MHRLKKASAFLNLAGIPTFDSPERAIRAYMNFYRYAQNSKMLQEIPPRLPKELFFNREQAKLQITSSIDAGRYQLTETEAKSILKLYGIPVNQTVTAATAPDAVKAAEKIGFPVVMKINSRQISHKSDAGGVRLNIADAPEVTRVFDDLMATAAQYDPHAEIEGVTIQRMMPAPEYELIVGAKKDPDFGPVILFGLGGTLTEIWKDTAIGLPPLNRLLARRIIEETKAAKLLQGFRKYRPANIMRLEEILIRVAQLVIDFPQISELDVNPLLVQTDDFVAVDARISLKPTRESSPNHLVISSYPAEQESIITIAPLGNILVRPIRPEDAPSMIALFEVLSRQTIYNRFFTPLRQLPHYMLTRFTQIDYDREIALVAMWNNGQENKMLGVARIIDDKDSKEAEFAVLVGDPWHGKGIGAALLARCLLIAKTRRIRKVYGTVLATNTHMLGLGKKLGFKVERRKDFKEFYLSCDLTSLPMNVLEPSWEKEE